MVDPQDPFKEANQESRPSIVVEFIYYLRANKKWWLLPILIMFSILSALVFLTTTGASPFIYTFF